jgi:hypothetical protein
MQKTESIDQQAAKNGGYGYVKYVWFTVYASIMVKLHKIVQYVQRLTMWKIIDIIVL